MGITQWDDDDEEEGDPSQQRFCPWCGTTVVSGGQFCASCGKSLSGTPPASVSAKVVSMAKASGAMIGTGIVTALVIVGIGVWTISSLRHELNIWGSLFGIGGTSAECKGVEGWYLAAGDRLTEVGEQAQRLDVEGGTQVDVLAILRAMDQAAIAQANPDPPPAAEPLNDLYVSAAQATTKAVRSMLARESNWSIHWDASGDLLEQADVAARALREQCDF